MDHISLRASVVELVDALDSKSSARKGVGVRFSPEAPITCAVSRTFSPVEANKKTPAFPRGF